MKIILWQYKEIANLVFAAIYDNKLIILFFSSLIPIVYYNDDNVSW